MISKQKTTLHLKRLLELLIWDYKYTVHKLNFMKVCKMIWNEAFSDRDWLDPGINSGLSNLQTDGFIASCMAFHDRSIGYKQ